MQSSPHARAMFMWALMLMNDYTAFPINARSVVGIVLPTSIAFALLYLDLLAPYVLVGVRWRKSERNQVNGIK